jgi:hypothetical protein
MNVEKLSKEYMIQQVVAHKDMLREATDQLSQTLSQTKSKLKASGKWELDEKSALRIREIIHEIMEEISIIGGFCDSWTQNYIRQIAPIIAGITAFDMTILDRHTLELFATMVNSLIVDFTKTPFRLSELKPIFSMLTETVKRK